MNCTAMEPIFCDDGVQVAVFCSTRPGPDAIFSQPNRLCTKQGAQDVAKKGVHQLAIQNQVAKSSKSQPYLAVSRSAIHCGREPSALLTPFSVPLHLKPRPHPGPDSASEDGAGLGNLASF